MSRGDRPTFFKREVDDSIAERALSYAIVNMIYFAENRVMDSSKKLLGDVFKVLEKYDDACFVSRIEKRRRLFKLLDENLDKILFVIQGDNKLLFDLFSSRSLGFFNLMSNMFDKTLSTKYLSALMNAATLGHAGALKKITTYILVWPVFQPTKKSIEWALEYTRASQDTTLLDALDIREIPEKETVEYRTCLNDQYQKQSELYQSLMEDDYSEISNNY